MENSFAALRLTTPAELVKAQLNRVATLRGCRGFVAGGLKLLSATSDSINVATGYCPAKLLKTA